MLPKRHKQIHITGRCPRLHGKVGRVELLKVVADGDRNDTGAGRPESLGDLFTQSHLVQQQQPASLRQVARCAVSQLLPGRTPKPLVQRIAPETASAACRRGGRVDPVAVSLEGIGGQGDPTSAFTRKESVPIDGNTRKPQAPERVQQELLVCLIALAGNQRRQDRLLRFARRVGPGEGIERLARPNLKQGVFSPFQQDRKSVAEADGLAQVSGPVRGIGRLRRGDPVSGDVRHEGDAGRMQVHPGKSLQERFQDWRHHSGMECVRRTKRSARDLLRRQPACKSLDGTIAARNGQCPGAILQRKIQITAKVWGQFLFRHGHGEHGAAGELLHQACPRTDDLQCLFQ